MSKYKTGQMYTKNYSPEADYLQLDISGLTIKDIILKYPNLSKTNKPLILHGDWEKNTTSNSLLDPKRKLEYKEIVEYLSENFNVLGLTIHPITKTVNRKKVFLSGMLEHLYILKEMLNTNVILENRSNSKFHFSTYEDIISCIDTDIKICIDIPQYSISVGNDLSVLHSDLKDFKKNLNILEYHLGGLLLKEVNGRHRSFVGQHFKNSFINYSSFNDLFENCLVTLEVLGGTKAFLECKKLLFNV